MRFGPREMMFLALLVATPVVAYFWVFAPMADRTEQIFANVQEKEQKLDRLAQATQSRDDLGAEIDKLSSAISLFEQKLPAQQEMDVILKKVWELAGRHDLEARSIRNDQVVETPNYVERPINVVIAGDFDGFYSFLLDLERLPRITRLKRLDLSKVSGEDGVMEASLVLSIFFEGKQAQSKPGSRT